MGNYIRLIKLINKYREYKEKITIIENGKWRDNPKIESLPIEKIANMIYIVNILEEAGIKKLARQYVD